MVVARASGMDLASILKRNTFLTLEVRPVGVRAGGPPGTGGQSGARDRGTRGGPGTGGRGGPGRGGTRGARDGGARRGPTPFWRSRPGAEKLWDDFCFFRYAGKKLRDTKQIVDSMLGGPLPGRLVAFSAARLRGSLSRQ